MILTGAADEEPFTIDKIGNNKQSMDTLFCRVFASDITKGVNIYGLGKNDPFVFRGNAKDKITLRTIGGDREDKFIDSTTIKDYG